MHQGYIPHVKLGRLDKVIRWIEKKENNGRRKRKVDVEGAGGVRRY
jgi:hypothetical protein